MQRLGRGECFIGFADKKEIFQTFRVGRKAVALIGGNTQFVGGGNASHYKSFADINSTTDFVHDF